MLSTQLKLFVSELGFTDAITKDWGGAPFVDLQKGWKEALKKYPQV
jgi:dipeptidyl aminopeptidase/acylaminoacyl peptidase